MPVARLAFQSFCFAVATTPPPLYRVTAAGYGALHAIFYVHYTGSLEEVVLELEETSLLTGWVVMLLFAALAMTSSDSSVRRMGKWWKRLQMGAYLATLFTVIHWWLIDQFVDQMLMWSVPLALLQAPRLLKLMKSAPAGRRRRSTSSQTG